MAKRINLVPQSERSRTSTDFGMLAMVAVAILIVFGLGLAYYMYNGRLDDKRQELADVEQQVSQLQAQVAALDEFGRLSSQREQAEAVAQEIYAGRTLVANLLDSVSLVVPDDAWFTTMSLETGDPTPKSTQSSASDSPEPGDMAIQGNSYGFEGVARVLVRLKLIPSLTDVSLLSAGEPQSDTDPTKDVKGFSVEASVVNDQPADTPLPVSQAEVVTP